MRYEKKLYCVVIIIDGPLTYVQGLLETQNLTASHLQKEKEGERESGQGYSLFSPWEEEKSILSQHWAHRHTPSIQTFTSFVTGKGFEYLGNHFINIS